MDITHHVEDLQQRLAVAADASGDDARQLAQRLTAPLDAAVRLVLLDALSEAAGEISAELAPGSVDVRLRGGDPEFVVVPPVTAEAHQDPAAPAMTRPAQAPAASSGAPIADADGAATTRTTLRLPDRLKAQVEVAAARDGVSVNTWLVRAVAAALEPSAARSAPDAGPEARGRNRHTGWVR
ncbi:toxin-antitoxin system HicB family antitoxin [Myceligenerans salitolerans]|uniref:Toxin-antitoxin system HicB family antitoxin n=1 Tax=Myceligenerans salitolerans TaxID=1230528 RepID=A0ABS3IBI6_9MICO|nr:toxin-antitoxin system HicB family antitoxin [Myceligenerans salitolerans]MBO0610310.1 toxin-antitoxin system HicB family antitoxin [Myceligenerans salitolerans]